MAFLEKLPQKYPHDRLLLFSPFLKYFLSERVGVLLLHFYYRTFTTLRLCWVLEVQGWREPSPLFCQCRSACALTASKAASAFLPFFIFLLERVGCYQGVIIAFLPHFGALFGAGGSTACSVSVALAASAPPLFCPFLFFSLSERGRCFLHFYHILSLLSAGGNTGCRSASVGALAVSPPPKPPSAPRVLRKQNPRFCLPRAAGPGWRRRSEPAPTATTATFPPRSPSPARPSRHHPP